MKSFTETEVWLVDIRPGATLDRAKLQQEFDALLGANGPALARLAAAYTNSRSDRDDLLQEIALAVWQALPGFRGECSVRTFLFRIAHNRAIAYLARNRTRFPAGADREARDSSPDPETGMVREQSTERLRRAIQELPLLYRQTIMLALEDLGYAEIAVVMGISESNVGARLSRARQLLRAALEKSE